jgi:hypothetical protein
MQMYRVFIHLFIVPLTGGTRKRIANVMEALCSVRE